MHRSALMRLALGVGVLMMTLALTGCGSGSAQEEEANARPLPEPGQTLRPGEYRSEEFEPSFSFRVGKGWSLDTETSDGLVILRPYLGMAIVRVEEVYKPVRESDKTSMPTPVKVPEDLVGWFQDHPYLKVEGLEPITVGGIEGQQFDFVADVPEGRYSMCGADCVDAFENSDGSSLVLDEGDKYHAVILDVKGETVYIESAAPPANWDKVGPEAQKVVDTVEWKSS
jgi:hypothetical protein